MNQLLVRLARQTKNDMYTDPYPLPEMLINGLKDAGFNTENVLFAKSLNKGNDLLNEIMKEGDVVLFENDLPDNYN